MKPFYLAAALTLAVLGGTCCALPDYPSLSYLESLPRIDYRVVFRVRALCSTGGQMGSGFAVGPHSIVTARHVVTCSDGEPLSVLLARGGQGEPDELMLATIARFPDDKNVDAVLLHLELDTLDVWARPARRAIAVQDYLCVVTGWLSKKCGYVAWNDEQGTVMVARAVQGNSGSPIFNTEGSVVGLLKGGTLAPGPDTEEYITVVPIDRWEALTFP